MPQTHRFDSKFSWPDRPWKFTHPWTFGKICSSCKKHLGEGKFKCSRCLCVAYCDRECQMKAFKEHKVLCNRVGKLNKDIEEQKSKAKTKLERGKLAVALMDLFWARIDFLERECSYLGAQEALLIPGQLKAVFPDFSLSADKLKSLLGIVFKGPDQFILRAAKDLSQMIGWSQVKFNDIYSHKDPATGAVQLEPVIQARILPLVAHLRGEKQISHFFDMYGFDLILALSLRFRCVR